MRRPTLFISTLKRKERQRLENQVRCSREPRYTDRLRAVLWSEQHKSVPEIARLLGKHATTVSRWLNDYLHLGLRGLRVGKSSGRPRSIDADGEVCLRQAALHNPRDMGYRFTRWTTATLTEHLYSKLHVRVSTDTVRRALRRQDFRYKRPKLSLRHRQNRRAVRLAKAARDAALKKPGGGRNGTSFSSKTSASFISIPA